MKGRASEEEVKGIKGIGSQLTEVEGIVVPVDWDDEGNALAVAISSPDEKEYLVQDDAKGKELLSLIRQEIVVSGVIGKVIKSRKTIVVKSYALKSVGNGRAKRRLKGSNGPILWAGLTERIT